MKTIVALCFVAAVAQAIDVDWNNLVSLDVTPVDLLPHLEERARQGEPEIAQRITAGEEARIGQFPYQVGLLIQVNAGTSFCGGSIISEEWILTAAHCVDTAIAIEVIIGGHNVVNPEAGQIRIPASEIIWHENWDDQTVKQDIAVLKLSTPIEFNARVQPIRLASRAQVSTTFAGETGIVSGWGRTESTTSISPVLRWTSNPITTNVRCSIFYFGSIIPNQICLDASGGRSSCNGDSGGPLVVIEADGHPTQVGVVSHGIVLGCQSGWPGVYSRVTHFLDWIAANTGLAI